MKRAGLLLLVLAACREPTPPPAPPPSPPASSRLPALETEVRSLEDHLATSGLRVPAQLPESTAKQVIEADAARAKAVARVEIDLPRKGKVPWKSRVDPAGRVWDVAAGAIAGQAGGPPRLLVVVDHSGFLDGYFPVIPAEDLAAAEGTPEARVPALERNVQVLRGRRAVIDAVADELGRQRRLVEASRQLGPRHLRIDPGSVRATLTFADAPAADRAAASPIVKELGLTVKNAGVRVELGFPERPAAGAD